jgi:hypothetical protein
VADAAMPIQEFTVVRRIPQQHPEIFCVPANIAAGTESIFPQLRMKDTGIYDSNGWQRVMLALWYIARNTTGKLEYEQVAIGNKPEIQTSALDEENGAVLAVDLVDDGAKRIWLDETGAAIIDASDNSYILI